MKIWRYLEFERFEQMIESQSIFLPRADKFKDRFEGSYTKTDVIHKNRLYNDPSNYKKWRRHFTISCWHKNEYECDGMWDLYSSKNKGIAVQSTYERLKEAFGNQINYITEVKYIDYEKESFPNDQIQTPFEFKRIFFKHEQEVRAIKWELPPANFIKNDLPKPGKPGSENIIPYPGISIEVDLKLLLEAVFLSPNLDEKLFKKVKFLLNKYDLNEIPVKISALSKDPVW